MPQGMLRNSSGRAVCRRACCAIVVGGLCAAGHVAQWATLATWTNCRKWLTFADLLTSF